MERWIPRPGWKSISACRWHVFDPRNNIPLIGRILIANGRDAADMPLTHNFGPGVLSSFTV